eukprot:scaffold13373_cov102-Isochrysis_galbana.AAC.5
MVACGMEYRSKEAAAYSEHVGMNRHPGGRRGEMVCLYHLRNIRAASVAGDLSTRLKRSWRDAHGLIDRKQDEGEEGSSHAMWERQLFARAAADVFT